MYADIRAILDAALSAGGGSYECGTHGQAVHWRQRAYRFRKLFAETLGLSRESEYDCLVMPRVEPDSSVVTIRLRKQVGVFVPSGEPTADIIFGDPLFEEAEALARRLEGDGNV
jgi:hypothetical protein